MVRLHFVTVRRKIERPFATLVLLSPQRADLAPTTRAVTSPLQSFELRHRIKNDPDVSYEGPRWPTHILLGEYDSDSESTRDDRMEGSGLLRIWLHSRGRFRARTSGDPRDAKTLGWYGDYTLTNCLPQEQGDVAPKRRWVLWIANGI